MDYKTKINRNAVLLILSISILISCVYSILYYTDIKNKLLENFINSSQIFSEHVTKTIISSHKNLYIYGSELEKKAYKELISFYLKRVDIRLYNIIIIDEIGNVQFDSNEIKNTGIEQEDIYSSLSVEYLDKFTINIRKLTIDNKDFIQINSPYINRNGDQSHFVIFLYDLSFFNSKINTVIFKITLLILGSIIISLILSMIYVNSNNTTLTQLLTERDFYNHEYHEYKDYNVQNESYYNKSNIKKNIDSQDEYFRNNKGMNDKYNYARIEPHNISNLIRKASENFKSNNIKEALKIYQMLFNEYPDNTKILNNIGIIYLKKDNPHRALRYFKIVSKLDPNFKGINEKIKLAQSLIKNK